MNIIQWAKGLIILSFFSFGIYVVVKRKGILLSDRMHVVNDKSPDTSAAMTEAYLLVPCMSGFLGDAMGLQHLSSAYLNDKAAALRSPEAGIGEPANNGRLNPSCRGER
jgi:hypothetical protein